MPGLSAEQLEARLAARTAELRAIVETIPDSIITIDEAGIVQSFSVAAERLFGYEAQEVVGRNVSVLMPEPFRGEHDEYLAHYRRTGEKRIIGIGRIVVGRRKDGTTFPLELSVGEMEVNGKRRFLGSIRDVSRRQETERELQSLQGALLEASRLTALGEMSSALAHELNQPLSAIMSYLDAGKHLLAATGAELPEQALSMFAKASEQARRAGDIIHRMRQMARRGDADRQVIDLNSMVQDAVALALVGSAHHGTTVDFELGAGLPAVLVDKTQIQQVVLNLVRNSLEALEADGGGRVVVRTDAAENNFLRITISDSGPGLAPEVSARLFQPFVTTKAAGTGIGLSICRSIIEAHHGRISAGTGPEGGAAFSVTVPCAPATIC